MNKKAILASLLITGVGVALLVIFMKRFEKEAAGGAPITVVIATTDLKEGKSVTESGIGFRTIPEAYVEPRQIRAEDMRRVLGLRLRNDVPGNTTLVWSDVSTSVDRATGLNEMLTSGTRAINIGVPSTSAFNGLLRPGDHVDVLHSSSAEPILESMMVIAINGRTGHNGNGCPGNKPQVTLAVTPQQAQLLSAASARGSLSLVLRSSEDSNIPGGAAAAAPAPGGSALAQGR